MTYIDQLRTASWKYEKSCHLLADGKDELVAFAASIGLKERWLQKSRKGLWHFDLNESMREKALAAGAKEMGMDEMYQLMKKLEMPRMT